MNPRRLPTAFAALAVASIFASACSGGGSTEPTAPPVAERPAGVPESASPAESPHGIVWVGCVAAASGRDRFSCSVHLGETGELWSEGDYVLRREGSDGFSPLDVFPGGLTYLSWDREVVRADGNLALLPDGLIEFPVDESVGIKQLYVEGKEVGEPVPFERQD